jgi:TonB family protein
VISKTPARYPEVARSRAVFGTVKVQAMVNERGDVTAVKFVSGSPILAAAAKDAVMHWKFRPAQLNGHPAPGSAAVEVAFGDPNQ